MHGEGRRKPWVVFFTLSGLFWTNPVVELGENLESFPATKEYNTAKGLRKKEEVSQRTRGEKRGTEMKRTKRKECDGKSEKRIEN